MGEAPLPLETIHDLLAGRRRRYTLYCLYMYTTPIGLSDVAEQATMWEYGVSSGELLDERLGMYNDLYHTHVPKLADSDVVVYSQDEDVLDLARNASQLRPYLERAADRDLEGTDLFET